MKRQSEIKSKLINFIKVVFALGAMIAICTFISRTNQQNVYAQHPQTASQLNYEDLSIIDAAVTVANGTEQDDIYNNNIKNTKVSVRFKNTDTGNIEKDNWVQVAAVDWNIDPVEKYDQNNKAQQTLTWKGKVSISKDNEIVSTDGKYYIVLSEDKNASATVTVLAAPETYTFSTVLPPEDWGFVNGTSITDMLTEIKKLYPKLDIDVTSSTTGKTETWSQAVDVEWASNPDGAYDPKSSKEQTLTWTGTVKKQTVTSGTKTTEIPSDQTVKMTVVVASNIDDYDNVKESSMSGDYDDSDLGKIKATISKSDVKKILKAQKGSIADEIALAMAGGKSLSIMIYVEKLSKDDVDDNIIDKFKDKSDGKVGTICDIKLYLLVAGEKGSQIENPGHTITFTHTIPSDIKRSSSSSNGKKYKRKFREYRYHDGSVHSCDEDWTDSDSPSSVKFKSSEFSYYALMYKDDETGSSSSSSSRSSSGSNLPRTSSGNATTGAGGGGGAGSGGGAPKTGDDFDARKWVFFMVVGVVVALCSFILYQDTKDWRDEKKEVKS